MSFPAKKKIFVSHSSDVNKAQKAATEMAAEIGFDNKVTNEITLVVKELASNLAKYATLGRLILSQLSDHGRAGIKIESVDSGPGIADVKQAIMDEFSTSDSLGYGLGSVNRMMDEFDIQSQRSEGGGTQIVCKRWISGETHEISSCPLSLGAATRISPHSKLNGDAFVLKKWDKSALAAVIDGLGHGKHAHHAAKKAQEYIDSHFDQPLKNIFHGVGYNCRGTRGVVMALARFDWEKTRLTFASIGNIEARVFGSPEPMKFVIRRGIVGVKAPNPVVTEHRWGPNNMMVLHSDGMRTNWRWEVFSHLSDKSATVIAQKLISALVKDNDDATVVVVKGALR